MTTEERKTYDSGAERSKLDDVRFDLISPIALRRIAAVYAVGASRYSDNNWRKGFPYSVLLNHAEAHINNWKQSVSPSGEDELAHAAWNLLALLEQETTHPELDDRWVFGVNIGPITPTEMAAAEGPTIPTAERCGVACRCSVAPLHYCQKPFGHIKPHDTVPSMGGWE